MHSLSVAEFIGVCVCVCSDEGRGLQFVESENMSFCESGPVSAAERETLRMSCCVTDAVGSVEFQWLMLEEEEEELVEGGRVSIMSTVNSSTLQLRGAMAEDEGVYCCVASDYLSTIKRNVTVSIMGELRSNTRLSLRQLNRLCEELMGANKSRLFHV